MLASYRRVADAELLHHRSADQNSMIHAAMAPTFSQDGIGMLPVISQNNFLIVASSWRHCFNHSIFITWLLSIFLYVQLTTVTCELHLVPVSCDSH